MPYHLCLSFPKGVKEIMFKIQKLFCNHLDMQSILFMLLACLCCALLSGEGHLSCTHLSNHTPHT